MIGASATKSRKASTHVRMLEARLAGQEGRRQAVHALGVRRHVAAGVDVDVEAPPRRHEVLDLQAGDFHQPVAGGGLEAGGLGVKDDLARHPR